METVATWSGNGRILVISVILLGSCITKPTYIKNLPIGIYPKNYELSNSRCDSQ